MFGQPKEGIDICKQCHRKKIQNVKCGHSIVEAAHETNLLFSKQKALVSKTLKCQTEESPTEQSLLKLKNTSLKEKIEENIPKTNDSCLSTDDIKWLGKNYNSSCGKLVFANAKSIGAKKSECRYSTLSEYKKSQPKEIQHEIHKTALDLVKRVQLHEQELWKQLAEISLSSASPSIVSNPLEENKILNEKDDFRTLSSFGFPSFFVPEKIPEKQHFAVKSDSAPAVVFDKDISVSTENSLSLLGDEWFDNLLRAELEISI